MILSLDKNIPMSLLLLSRVATLPAGHSVTYEDLRNAVAHLPDTLVRFTSLVHILSILEFVGEVEVSIIKSFDLYGYKGTHKITKLLNFLIKLTHSCIVNVYIFYN
jgi:hypothetical protein